MGKRLCNVDFSFLPMSLVSSTKNQSKLFKSLLIGDQCLGRVMFCLKPFDLNDFSLKLMKYSMFSNSYFCEKKSEIELPQKTQALHFATPVCHVFCITWLPSIKSLMKVL